MFFVVRKSGSRWNHRLHDLCSFTWEGFLQCKYSLTCANGHLRIATTCQQKPLFQGPNFHFQSIKAPLNNNQLPTTAAIFGSQGWSFHKGLTVSSFNDKSFFFHVATRIYSQLSTNFTYLPCFRVILAAPSSTATKVLINACRLALCHGALVVPTKNTLQSTPGSPN